MDEDFFDEVDELVTYIYRSEEHPEIILKSGDFCSEEIKMVIIRKRDLPADSIFLRFRDGKNGDIPQGQRVYQSIGVRETHEKMLNVTKKMILIL